MAIILGLMVDLFIEVNRLTCVYVEAFQCEVCGLLVMTRGAASQYL